MDKIFLKEKDYIISLRRYFHKYPEASLNEYNTRDKIEKELDDLNIRHCRIGKTGVIGFIGNERSERSVALRASMDAVEVNEQSSFDYKSVNQGLMHSGGHDCQMASLLGAAKILKQNEDDLNGVVKLIFQPGEEIGKGAKLFTRTQHLKDTLGILSLEYTSELNTGQLGLKSGLVAASCDYFKVRIKGRSGHVSAQDRAVDSLYIASSMVVNLQSIVSRMSNPLDPILLSVGKLSSGTRYNIIAETAEFEGTFRTVNKESRKKVKEAIEKVILANANMSGADVEIVFEELSDEIRNDEETITSLIYLACPIVGNDNLIRMKMPSLSSDDFSHYLKNIPGAYIFVGTRNKRKKETSLCHHNPLFDVDERSLIISTVILVKYVYQVLNDNQIIIDNMSDDDYNYIQ